jgi:hypothetical protein
MLELFSSIWHVLNMPRYFFNIHHDTVHLDHEGEELPDKHAAWKEATVMAGKILQDLDGKLFPAAVRAPSHGGTTTFVHFSTLRRLSTGKPSCGDPVLPK